MNRTLQLPAMVLMLSPLMLLASCGKQSAPQAGSTASGSVLPATVSDAMLSTDRSQAEAPLAPGAAIAASKVGTSAAPTASDPAAESSESTADTAQPPEPAATPAPASKPKPAASSKPSTAKPAVAKPTVAKPAAG